MPSAVPIAPQMPAVASLPQLSLPTAAVAGKLPIAPTEFSDALAKLVAAAPPADQQATTTDTPTTAVAAAPDPQPSVPAQPQQAPAVAGTLPPPETTTPTAPDAATSKSSRNAPPVRRAAATRVAQVEIAADQPAAPTTAQPQSVAVTAPEHAPEPTAPATHRQQSEAPRAIDAAGPASMPQVLTKQAEAKPSSPEATPSPSSQAALVATPAQPVSVSPTDLTARMLPTSPEPAAQPATLTETAATPVASTHAASPAAQLAPALVQIGHAPDGAQRLTVRLDPPELGHVQVRIDRPSEASARVEITVEKAETLTLLLRDQPQLQRALDQAGVPAEGRSVTFHVASPDPAPHSDPSTTPAPGVAAGGPGGDGSHGAARNGGHSGRQHAGTPDSTDTEFTPIVPLGWVRGGLDITA
jgi:flagellar hook-length control protein FliK